VAGGGRLSLQGVGRGQVAEDCRLESERTISNDLVVRYDDRFFQLQQPSRDNALAQAKVLVCEQQEGMLAIEYRGEKQWLMKLHTYGLLRNSFRLLRLGRRLL
jgi:hypothetical protein